MKFITIVHFVIKVPKLVHMYFDIQVSLAVRGGYVPENCREWQNRERQDVSSMRMVGLRS